MKPSLPIYAHINVATVQVKDRPSRLRVYRKNSISRRISAHVVIALFILFPTVGGCTSIVAILVNNQTLVIAADSKETQIVSGGAANTRSRCKINVGNKFAWATFGIVQDQTLDIITAIQRVANTNDSASSKVMRLDELMFKVLHQEAERIRTRDPRFFQQLLNGVEMSSALFIGFYNVKLTFSNRDYSISLVNGKINLDSKWAKDCPGKGCLTTQMFVIGTEDAVQRYIIAHPKAKIPMTVQAAMDTAIELVQLQMDATPEWVGPPIETAIIDSQGVHWGEHNTECRDIKKPAKSTTKPTPKGR